MGSSAQVHVPSFSDAVIAAEKYSALARWGYSGKPTSKTNQNLQAQTTCKCPRHSSIDLETTALSDNVDDYTKDGAGIRVLMKVPTDIFIEIAQYLHPTDLLHFSTANKFLRGLFVSQQAAPIWRSAQLGIPGLPPCPVSICEAHYAALLFTKRCSACGERTDHKMDAILLVRLCGECFSKRIVDAFTAVDRSLVFVSYDYVPGNHCKLGWCLTSDDQAVRSKLDELEATEDRGAKARWMKERRKEVNQRYWCAQPLRKWLDVCTRMGIDELAQYGMARQVEIESRLERLGWEEGDFSSSQSRGDRQLKFLMRNPEPLTDWVWEKLLPELLEYLNPNREERLQREMAARKYERELILRDCIYTISNQLGPFSQVCSEGELPPVTSVDARWNFTHDRLFLAYPFPSAYQAYSRPELKPLLGADMPTVDFITQLVEHKSTLKKGIIAWRSEVEASLVMLLPEDIASPQLDDFPAFVIKDGAGCEMELLRNLPIALKKLLRADATFMGQDRLRFYPDDFVNTSLNASDVTYHIQAAKIAKALLSALNQPDASYLKLKALGRAFHCGRCHSPPRYMTWYEIVQHYLAEADAWYQHSVAREVCEAKDFTMIFTHNVDAVNLTRPLVLMQIVGNSSALLAHHGSTKRCKVCQSVRIRRWCHVDHILDHVRDVHLVEEPKLGIHYG